MRLKNVLNEIDPSYIIEGPLTSCDEVCEYFSLEKKPDLVLSDIRLTDGLVFDAFDQIGCESRIIFTTAYSEYAIRAFQYNSIQYILKPIVKDELEAAMAKSERHKAELLSELGELGLRQQPDAVRKRFLVPWRGGFEIVRTDDVAYVFHEKRTVRIFLHNGSSFPLEMNIDECEMQLDRDMFFRANRQFIVNVNAIKNLISYRDRKMRVVLKDFPDVEIMVSRLKSKPIRDWLDR